MSDLPSESGDLEVPTSPATHGAAAPAASEAPPAATGPKKSFSDAMKGVFASIDPVAKNVSKELNKSFHQVVQFAGEKLGTAEVTPLPQEYIDLELRVDRLRALHENLARIAALQVNPGAATDLKFTVSGALTNVTDSLGTTQEQQLNNVNEKLRNVSVNPHNPNQVLADEFSGAGLVMGEDTPLGSALIKSADVQRKIGKARTHMNSEINEKFIKRMNRNLDSAFRNTNQYRRLVHSSRVKLDALKARARAATPEKADQLSDELQLAQGEFNSLVATTIDSMKVTVSSTEPLAALADMMTSMLTYFQTGAELLSELAPELDAIKVAQESESV